jgi:lipopolysaccharide transport system permease protein
MPHRPTMIQKIRWYYNQRDLLMNYVRKDLKERYVGSVFGFYWSVINPLILLGIYTFVFSVIFQVRFGGQPGFGLAALYIFCGMVPWMAFHEAVGRSTGILIDNANLIKKVMFPSKILPMYIVFSHFVNLLIGFGILLAAVLLTGRALTPWLLLLPLYIFAQLLLTLGACWLASTVNVFLRDSAQLINQLLIILMYLSPIFYSVSMIPEGVRRYAYINPMAGLIEGYRDILLNGTAPNLGGLAYFYAVALVIFVAGYAVFSRNQHTFADVL